MMKLKGLFTTQDSRAKKRAVRYRQLLMEEAILGGQIFGPPPQNGRREFFCLDEKTWIWHEEWIDAKGEQHSQTTRYEVRANGIVKRQNDGPYMLLSRTEADNLVKAAKRYKNEINVKLYFDVS